MVKTKTTSQKTQTEKWYLVDARGKRLGKLASTVAELLMGKGDVSMRDYIMPMHKVVITNAQHLDIAERKKVNKLYTNYSGYPGGLKIFTLGEMMGKSPVEVVRRAIKGMLPRTKRSDAIFSNNLYVYAESEHKHQAQEPQFINVIVK